MGASGQGLGSGLHPYSWDLISRGREQSFMGSVQDLAWTQYVWTAKVLAPESEIRISPN